MSASRSRRRLAGSAVLAVLVLSCGVPNSAGVGAGPPPTAAPLTSDGSPPDDPPPDDPPPEHPRPDDPPPIPNGNTPPGVEHDIPTPEEDDFAQRSQWEDALASACDEAGQPRNCLVFTYEVYVAEPGGGRTRLDDLGAYEVGDYTGCPVESIDPPTGESVTVAPGTRIVVVAVCEPDPEAGGDTETSPPTGSTTTDESDG